MSFGSGTENDILLITIPIIPIIALCCNCLCSCEKGMVKHEGVQDRWGFICINQGASVAIREKSGAVGEYEDFHACFLRSPSI